MKRLNLLLMGLTLTACATPEPVGVLTLDDPGLRSLSWLVGAWYGEEDGRRWEEHWIPASGGSMFGIHRDTLAGELQFFEYLRIEAQGDDEVVFHASPLGREATPFRRTESGHRRVVFENSEHDFPRRVIYWIDQAGRLNARVDGGQDDDENAQVWVFRRVQVMRYRGR